MDAIWLGNSRFSSSSERVRAAKHWLDERFGVEVENAPTPIAVDVFLRLVEPLRRQYPLASQAAEAALSLLTIMMVEGRKLDLRDDAGGDLERNRLAGDRTISDYLCREILQPRNIPATQGPLQSSSYRSGYAASQVRDQALTQFVEWVHSDEVDFGACEPLAEALVAEFRAKAADIVSLPPLLGSAFTFSAYRRVRDILFVKGSGGALEQYLLAGLLDQELTYRVLSKSVGANDRAAGTAGDIELRDGQTLIGSIEVTAAEWSSKVAQLEGAA